MLSRTFSMILLAVSIAALLTGCGSPKERPDSNGALNVALTYPTAPAAEFVETLHGVQVPDPYRWLEKEDTPQTRDWIRAQNLVTNDFLASVGERGALERRLTKLWNFEKRGLPFKEGGRYFYTHNTGLQDQPVLYTADSLSSPGRALLDPNALSKDGTVSLAGRSVSRDGKWLAYSTSSGGSDWREWRIRNIETGKDADDLLKWSKFSGASWTPDSKGFFYSRYAAPKEGEKLQGRVTFQKLYYHRMGTPQADDLLILEDKENADYGFGGWVTDDGKYLCVRVSKGTMRKNMFFYAPLEKLDLGARGGSMSGGGKFAGTFVKLIDQFIASFGYVANDGPVFYFRTSFNAPRNRVIAIDTGKPQKENWKEIIPQATESIRTVSFVNGQFIASYLKDARTSVKRFLRDGAMIDEIELPGIGTANGFGGKPEDTETFYSFSSFAAPPTVYRYDFLSGKSEVFFRPNIEFDPERFETKQVFYRSKDGTRVPMFITHKRGLELDGNNPTLLYGYGGFNISLTPRFSVANIVWMEMGGIFAQPSLRGGGEYGRAWHQGGMLFNKQNVFDDFFAAAEYLVDKKYTNRARLAIFGTSNGGLLVGACMTQRPDLFGAAMPNVGVLDMLRFHKFTIGHAWVSDYGSPDDEAAFKYLLDYSPYHNLKPGTEYPATLVTTADHDDRVVPAHSFKFAARLQAAHAGPNPVLIRIDTKAGHGAGKPTSMRIKEATDRWAFLLRVLAMEGSTEKFGGK